MNRHRFLLGMLLVLGLSLAPLAEAQVDTSRAYTFGDSLQDNDLLYLFFENDPALYGADPFEALFNQASEPGDLLANFAVLGSTTQDLLLQLDFYSQGRQAGVIPPATLISLQAGGNDILFNLNLLASAAPGESESVDAFVNQMKKNLRDAFLQIQRLDDADVILWTIPDVTTIPLVQAQGLPPFALDNVRAHIERLNQYIRNFSRRPNAMLLDLFSLNQAFALQPPVLQGIQLLPSPYFGFQAGLFADPIHPTAVANGLIANEMIRIVNDHFGDEIPAYSEEELADFAGLND